MSIPDPPPDPSTFRGVRLRTYLEQVHRWLKRDRIIAGTGVAIESTPAGRRISAGAGVGGGSGAVVPIRSTSVVTARSGTTPGTGSAVLVTDSTTALADGDAITVYTVSGLGHASGKYGYAVWRNGGWWVISLEC